MSIIIHPHFFRGGVEMKKKDLAIIAIVLGLILFTPMVTAADEKVAGSTVTVPVPASDSGVVYTNSPSDGLNIYNETFFATFRDDIPGKIDHSRPDEALVYNAKVNGLKAQMQAEGKTDADINAAIATIPSGWAGGLPSSGSPKFPVFLVDFSDYPHYADQTAAEVNSGFNLGGYASQYPYNSLRGYYQRSSFGKLNTQAQVWGWYRAAHPRSYYTDNEQALVKEVLNAYNPYINYAQYDNDGDGYVDALFIKWTGPSGAWASSWWAWQATGFDPAYVVDGKHLRKWVWSWYGGWGTGVDHHYYPRVDIHESGHLLGLPDLYDYTPTTYPKGGVGGWDMMDANKGDHNAFSKFLLGWVNTYYVASPANGGTFYLSPNSTPVMIMPSKWQQFQEMFIVEYRKANWGNDPVGFGPGDGLMIWHVDSTLNPAGTSYNFSNSDGLHKYMDLEQADGLHQIDSGGAGNIGDFFTPGKIFNTSSNPNSDSYYAYTYYCNGQKGAGDYTGVSVTNIQHPSTYTMSATFNVIEKVAATLTWTSAADLDLKAQTPYIWLTPVTSTPTYTSYYNIYYGNKGSIGEMPTIKSHIDESSGGSWYRPEIIQARTFFPGTTWFYVTRWSGAQLNRTGAKVEVFKNGAPVATYTMPTTGSTSIGNTWYVFYFDQRTGNIYGYNRLLSTPTGVAASVQAVADVPSAKEKTLTYTAPPLAKP
jgi:M6 family metalloprotease-like protein